ncbi:hypothetical protein SFRURICE_015749 [Spodoptera frugiperda]|nr:hypothetical protein SFRURICE_015749 [Spodoptera frugiperda]
MTNPMQQTCDSSGSDCLPSGPEVLTDAAGGIPRHAGRHSNQHSEHNIPTQREISKPTTSLRELFDEIFRIPKL